MGGRGVGYNHKTMVSRQIKLALKDKSLHGFVDTNEQWILSENLAPVTIVIQLCTYIII